MSIIICPNHGNAHILDKSHFKDENFLQEFIDKNPEAIPLYELEEGKKLLVVKREFSTTSGFIDAIAIDQSGGIYVVETKLYRNADKRKVVAQALDYGAALWKHSVDINAFVDIINDEIQEKFGLSFQEKAMDFFGVDAEETGLMIESLRGNLNEGNFKFLILMDSVDERLKDLIIYINQNSQFDIYAAQLEYYRFEEFEILVPKVFGAEVKKRVKNYEKFKKWDEESWYQELERLRGSTEVHIVSRFETRASGKPFTFRYSSQRRDDRATLWVFSDGDDPCRLCGFRVDGRIEIRFDKLMTHPPFDNESCRRDFADRLNKISGINLSKSLTLTGFPSVPISVLESENAFDMFFDALEWCVQEIESAKNV